MVHKAETIYVEEFSDLWFKGLLRIILTVFDFQSRFLYEMWFPVIFFVLDPLDTLFSVVA